MLPPALGQGGVVDRQKIGGGDPPVAVYVACGTDRKPRARAVGIRPHPHGRAVGIIPHPEAADGGERGV